jgi:hypothetical protein
VKTIPQSAPHRGKKNSINLKSEVEEGFLRSGTAKGAVPPVGMTDFGSWMKRENPTSSLRIKERIERRRSTDVAVLAHSTGPAVDVRRGV